MKENELLSSISKMLDEKLEQKLEEKLEQKLEEKLEQKLIPIENEIQKLNLRIGGVESLLENDIKPHLTNLETIMEKNVEPRLANLETNLDRVELSLNRVESSLDSVKSNLDRVKSSLDKGIEPRVKCIELSMENIVVPRLQNIEECYTSTYSRYRQGNEEHDAMKADINLLMKTVSEHSRVLEGIA